MTNIQTIDRIRRAIGSLVKLPSDLSKWHIESFGTGALSRNYHIKIDDVDCYYLDRIAAIKNLMKEFGTRPSLTESRNSLRISLSWPVKKDKENRQMEFFQSKNADYLDEVDKKIEELEKKWNIPESRMRVKQVAISEKNNTITWEFVNLNTYEKERHKFKYAKKKKDPKTLTWKEMDDIKNQRMPVEKGDRVRIQPKPAVEKYNIDPSDVGKVEEIYMGGGRSVQVVVKMPGGRKIVVPKSIVRKVGIVKVNELGKKLEELADRVKAKFYRAWQHPYNVESDPIRMAERYTKKLVPSSSRWTTLQWDQWWDLLKERIPEVAMEAGMFAKKAQEEIDVSLLDKIEYILDPLYIDWEYVEEPVEGIRVKTPEGAKAISGILERFDIPAWEDIGDPTFVVLGNKAQEETEFEKWWKNATFEEKRMLIEETYEGLNPKDTDFYAGQDLFSAGGTMNWAFEEGLVEAFYGRKKMKARIVKVGDKSAKIAEPVDVMKALDKLEKKQKKSNEEEEELKRSFIQYIKSGNNYSPAGEIKTVAKLPNHPYEVHLSMYGPVFERVKPLTDEIIDFEKSAMNDVVKEVDRFWESREAYDKLGLTHNRGILLYGPPGTGKSICLQQVANLMADREDVVFFVKNAEAILDGLKAFRQVEPGRRVVVAFEEADEMCKYNERDMLRIMDGDAKINGVLFLATTNYIDRLPERMLRPGRFDHKVFVDFPSYENRHQYLSHKLAPIGESEDRIRELAEKSDGLGFGHLRELITGIYAIGDPPDTVFAKLHFKASKTGSIVKLGSKNAAAQIKPEEVVNPEHYDQVAKMSGWIGSPEDIKKWVLEDSKPIAAAFNRLKVPVRYRGLVYSYTLDPSDWRKITASDGSEFKIQYLSDLGNYDREFLDMLFGLEPENWTTAVPGFDVGYVEQEEHELEIMRGGNVVRIGLNLKGQEYTREDAFITQEQLEESLRKRQKYNKGDRVMIKPTTENVMLYGRDKVGKPGEIIHVSGAGGRVYKFDVKLDDGTIVYFVAKSRLKRAEKVRVGLKLNAQEEEGLPGGEADNVPDEEFDEAALEQGTQVEMEHTDDPDVAKDIAKDHLVESPEYYDYLEEMEESMQTEGKKAQYGQTYWEGDKVIVTTDGEDRIEGVVEKVRKEERGASEIEWDYLVKLPDGSYWFELDQIVKKVSKVQVGTRKVLSKEETLADHAEAWWKEQGKEIPKEGTPEYEDMYQQWIEYAFADFGKVK